jgi:hypothetical protein
VLGRLVGPSLEQSYRTDSSGCPTCQSKLQPLLIAPTHLRDYRNPHLAQVWYEAEQVLREASRVVFIGYSLPEDDVEVIYLLRRSMAHLPTGQITVVEYDPAKPPPGRPSSRPPISYFVRGWSRLAPRRLGSVAAKSPRGSGMMAVITCYDGHFEASSRYHYRALCSQTRFGDFSLV